MRSQQSVLSKILSTIIKSKANHCNMVKNPTKLQELFCDGTVCLVHISQLDCLQQAEQLQTEMQKSEILNFTKMQHMKGSILT